MNKRYLIATADDYGMGPDTSRGILDLAAQGTLTCTVLLVNSPHAESGVKLWRQRGMPIELGWHPCLTLDGPVVPPGRVPTLVDGDGRFLALGTLLRRLHLGQVQAREIQIELEAQYERFCALVGHAPTVVNGHHHIHVFEPIGAILRALLGRQPALPYMRYVRERWSALLLLPGARAKRLCMTLLGRRACRRMAAAGFPGNDTLAGLTSPECVADPDFMTRWLRGVPGRAVELMCHPGYPDATLHGRDAEPGDVDDLRRGREQALLVDPAFAQARAEAGFRAVAPSEYLRLRQQRGRAA